MKICIVGLGYVGLPLAIEFSRHCKVIGFDKSKERIKELKNNIDRNAEISKDDIKICAVEFTDDVKRISEADYVIVAVPTPITKDYRPDLTLIEYASKLVGENLKKGAVVVYESTVYPGVTEDICIPIIERYSKLKCGPDFKVGYSPERVNPGDRNHTIDKIVKVVSGMDAETTKKIAQLYSKITKAGVFRAKDIKTAEAAKVIENIQRDLNIALVNELSLIFKKMGINTKDVLDAAGTKWNFHKYAPGLVGGHCIGVDPYYLTYKAKKLGYNPKVILAGRSVNEYMAEHVAKIMIECLKSKGKKTKDSAVLIMGLTFKENVKDIRNSKVFDVIKHLQNAKINVIVCDPIIDPSTFEKLKLKNARFEDVKNVDCIALLVPHTQFKDIKISDIREKTGALVDIKGIYNRDEAERAGLIYRSL